MTTTGCWLDLSGHVAIVSPHLDDAVLSLGAFIARAVRQGARVDVVTVFAGDPDSNAPAEPWDASCGYLLAGEVAAARREEDQRACSMLGANPVWLAFTTLARQRGREAEIVSAIAAATAPAATVLMPGFPLTHPEHALCAAIALQVATPGTKLGLYVEQPYAVWELVGSSKLLGRFAIRAGQVARRAFARQEPASPLEREARGTHLVWKPQQSDRRDRAAKRKALWAYGSQLRGFGRGTIEQVWLYDWSWGGELIARLPREAKRIPAS